ncbi:MAG TPA: aromatic ring-hydroxylating dioxygenase subunit alpha [Spongiibacteraceae bacterium]|nr:aromatic ring-hydroxylating dioxygenase subunit alpha [Spongiibacteraceae bacterium]
MTPANTAQKQDYIDNERIESSVGLLETGFDRSNLTVSIDRFTCPDYAARERELIWMKVWQTVGRVEDLPEVGDWKTYNIYDQSFIIVKGNDGKIRGFVNACTHRGNVMCTEKKGHAGARFTCPYHKWSFALDGRLVGVGRPDLVGPLDKTKHGLVEVPVDTLGGFIFMNPDANAISLREYMGEDIVRSLEPYHMEKMTKVMDVKEALECNWKVVNDAFQEGYHIDGVHPELLAVVVIDPSRTRYNFTSRHNLAVAPFDVKHANDPNFGADQEVAAVRALPGTFPGTAQVLPKFEELVAPYCKDGKYTFPEGVSSRTLLQQATRETLTMTGFDVSELTDEQMTDNHGYLLFPNFFLTVRAGECHVINATPHPDGDPNRCYWHVTSYMWLPEPVRDQFKAEPVEVTEPGSFPYFLALQQDYEQMPRQQKGLRNKLLKHMVLAQEEVCVAHFHSVVDRYMSGSEIA